MSAVDFALATRDDDASMRGLLASNPMPGRIRLRLEREPDYFAGCAAMGPFTQVLVARDGSRVVGLACRAVRPMYINGQPESAGYLGQLRIDPEYRGRSLVARGFRQLRALHEDGRARSYVTTIVEGNAQAEGVLVKHRRGVMPRYQYLDRLITLALPVPHRNGTARCATHDELSEVFAFLDREGRERNFFPVWQEGTTPGFDQRDFVLALRGERIAGVAGLWDQSAYKQTVIDGYDRVLAAARPIYNYAARATGRLTLPSAGSTVRAAYGSFFSAAGNNPAVVRELIEQLLLLARAKGLEVLLLGFAESDPSLVAAKAFRHVAYRSGIYSVSWDDGDSFHDRLDSRPRYLEIATL